LSAQFGERTRRLRSNDARAENEGRTAAVRKSRKDFLLVNCLRRIEIKEFGRESAEKMLSFLLTPQ
jgi:hypothetical protein